MPTTEKTINQLYTSIANGEVSKVKDCYSPIVQFQDPIFGILKNIEVPKMWEMLISNSKGNFKLEYKILKADDYMASAQWIANYSFGKKQRKIKNIVHSEFHLRDGLIIKQQDDFDIWKWSKQALGIPGILFGWTGYMQRKIQNKALTSLKNFIQSSSNQ